MDNDDHFPSTASFGQPPPSHRSVLSDRYHELQSPTAIHWSAQYRMLRLLGSGSQSTVWLADRDGSLRVSLRVALKLFSPALYSSTDAYLDEMSRTAQVAMRIAEIQQDYLTDVHNFIESGGIQIMVMEWVDGLDLTQLLKPQSLTHIEKTADVAVWNHVNEVIATAGESRVRVQPGVAIAVLRECLAGLAPLHRRRIIHGDIKPSNIMLKRTGHVKIIDYGSAFFVDTPRIFPAWTPQYAALEVLETGRFELNSDLASLGYVFLELLSGRAPFDKIRSHGDLIAIKKTLHDHITDYLPDDVARDANLVSLIRGMIHPDPTKRFQTPDDAELAKEGAASAHTRLVISGLSSEYSKEIRDWLRLIGAPDGDEAA